jgi:hypothetical protein
MTTAVFGSIAEAFQQCQASASHHKFRGRELARLLAQEDASTFTTAFIEHVSRVLVAPQKSVAVDRLLQFISANIVGEDSGNDAVSSPKWAHFRVAMVDYLVTCCTYENKFVRLRSLRILGDVLGRVESAKQLTLGRCALSRGFIDYDCYLLRVTLYCTYYGDSAASQGAGDAEQTPAQSSQQDGSVNASFRCVRQCHSPKQSHSPCLIVNVVGRVASIEDCLMERLADKLPEARVEAARGLLVLLSKNASNLEIIQSLCEAMSTDIDSYVTVCNSSMMHPAHLN